jgi:hypothetical protein
MPVVMPQELEGIAQSHPELYAVFMGLLNQLNQTAPSIASGTQPPESVVPAQPGTIYIQRNPQSGPTTLYVKDSGFGNTGWSKLGAFGSIPPSAGGGFQAVATSTSVTFYYDGTNGSSIVVVYRADGTATQIPAGKTVVTGLSPSTTYYFYPYYDERSRSLLWVAGTVGNVAIAFTAPSSFAAQTARLAHHIPLTPGTYIQVTTPSGGSSPSPVGGGFGGTGRYA